MKVISYLSWAASVIAGAMIIVGAISYVLNINLFGVTHAINFFHMANSFLLIVVCCLIYKRLNQ